MSDDRRGRPRRWLLLGGVGYVGLMGVVVWSMFAARSRALAETSTAESIAEWEEWRDDVIAEQSEPTPVKRRIPASTEPPALVLMRDNFGVSLAGAVLFSSLLYWVAAWLVLGALSSPRDFDNAL
jgi:hypothetical protein